MQENEKSSTQNIPQLAPPGAGIPWPHRLLGHLFLRPFIAERTPWEVSTKNFIKIHSKILKEIEGLSQRELTTKILVPPMRGLEDSSRYWSISMTLEHLMIVGQSVQAGIIELTAGRNIQQKVDIAQVKPKGQANFQELLTQFNSYALHTPSLLETKLKDKNSKTKHYHPWFGKFTAQGWYWLLAMHGGIHLQQIREIKKGLNKT